MDKARLSTSTWSLHRALGAPPIYGPAQGGTVPKFTPAPGSVTLLELPSRLAAIGIETLEICHFHLPTRDPNYLAELRGALEAANVELFTLLIDEGDLTGANSARDFSWIGGWLPVAQSLGARCARVIAGKSAPSPQNLAQSRDALLSLAARAEAHGLRLMTENWFDLLRDADAVLELFDALEGRVGLCLDFGNWSGAGKYDQLARIAPLAKSCHARADWVGAPPQLDADDFTRCLELTRDAGFSGPYTLIPSGPFGDEWEALARARDVARNYT